MALLRAPEVVKMSPQERTAKLKELRFSLTRGQVTANRATAKTKEIKKAIARLLTYEHMQKHREVKGK